MKRLLWIDISKGLAILFVAYFHFFATYFQHGVLPPSEWNNIAASTLTILRLAWFKISDLGFHAVGVFIILSGWTLMQSTMRRAEKGQIAWGTWYWARFVRLYPMYWVAHLVYLVSPFVARLEPVADRRSAGVERQEPPGVRNHLAVRRRVRVAGSSMAVGAGVADKFVKELLQCVGS